MKGFEYSLKSYDYYVWRRRGCALSSWNAVVSRVYSHPNHFDHGFDLKREFTGTNLNNTILLPCIIIIKINTKDWINMIYKRLLYYKIINMLNEEYYPYYLNKSDSLTLPPFESIIHDIINSCIEVDANVIDVQRLKKNFYRQELKECWVSNELKSTRDTKDSFYYEINRKAKAIFKLPRINSNILVDLYSTDDYQTLLTGETDKLYNWQNDINSLFIRYPFINSLYSQDYIDAIKNDIEFLSLNFITSNKTLHLIPDDVIDHYDQGNFNEILEFFHTDVRLVNYEEKIRLDSSFITKTHLI